MKSVAAGLSSDSQLKDIPSQTNKLRNINRLRVVERSSFVCHYVVGKTAKIGIAFKDNNLDT